uniref:Peptidase M13 C-terminal domain-containing protein n=1 Tax=Meloidogyne enterolobii TaxID=390850 RepID=A0A6V7WJC0_MELEN|nr:unnamed protein product [Meloidogyne enterolobii]
MDRIYVSYNEIHISNIKGDVTDIALKIKNSMKILIENNSSWLGRQLKNKMIKKLDDMKLVIGHFEEILDDKELEKEFSCFEFNEKMSFDEIELKTIECTLKRVSSMFQFKAGSDNILISNYAKFYHYSFDNKYGAVIEENLVYILSGALHFPNYELDMPLAMKFAQIGSIIGHAIAVILLDDVFKQDSKKIVTENFIEYKNRLKCFERQYKEIKDKANEEVVNNYLDLLDQTLYNVPNEIEKFNDQFGEEFVEMNLGMKAAFLAFKNIRKRKFEERDYIFKDGLIFTEENLFFIHYTFASF